MSLLQLSKVITTVKVMQQGVVFRAGTGLDCVCLRAGNECLYGHSNCLWGIVLGPCILVKAPICPLVIHVTIHMNPGLSVFFFFFLGHRKSARPPSVKRSLSESER